MTAEPTSGDDGEGDNSGEDGEGGSEGHGEDGVDDDDEDEHDEENKSEDDKDDNEDDNEDEAVGDEADAADEQESSSTDKDDNVVEEEEKAKTEGRHVPQGARYSGKGKGTSPNRGRHIGKGRQARTTVETEALHAVKKGKKGGTQADVDAAQAELDKAKKEARKAQQQHAVAKEAVDGRKREQPPEVEGEQEDGGGGVGVKKAKTTVGSQAKKSETTKKDTGDEDGSEPWHWQNVMKGSEHMGKDGVFDLEGFSEAQVRHGPQVQQ